MTTAPNVTFSWIEIVSTATNTSISGSSNYGGPYPIGFSFEFYGNLYTDFYANTEGYVSFGSASYDSSNDYMPDDWTPNNIIAPYWDNMVNYGGTICYQTIGSSPNQQLVIEWRNVTRSGYSDLMIFEVILNETGDIWFQYLQLGSLTGWSATVGIENSDGTVACQYSYGSYSLQDNMAIRFSKGPVWIGPTQAQSGRTSTDISYNLTVINLQSFADTFEITTTGSLGWTVSLYNSLLNPLTDTDGDTVVDTGSVPAQSKLNITVVVSIPASPAASVETTNVIATSHANSLNFFSSTLSTTAEVAWLSPPHSDFGRDTDSDGLFNYLVIEASVYVRVTDYYYIEADLYTGTGTYIDDDGNYTYLTAGMHKVWLEYYGWFVRGTGANGPYDVHLYLYDDTWTVIGDEWHSTQAYSYTAFMLVPGYLDPPHSDAAADADSDGLYDNLTLTIGVYANYAGRFVVSCYLYTNTNWSYVGYKTVTEDMSTGANTVQIVYSAWEVARANESGSFYAYLYLSAYVDGSSVQVGSGSHTTGAYTLSSFERPAVLFTPPHVDYAVDDDSDSLYDWLIIEVEISVSVEGDYVIEGELSSYGGTIDTVTNSTHFAVGYYTVELAFPGWPIRYMDDNDWFDCDLEARSGATVLDTDDYETDTYYHYYDFENAPGWFEPPHSYEVVDLDSDSLYDYVTIDAQVNVSVAGGYRVDIEFYADWWDVIYDTSNATYLNAGLNTVGFVVPGWLIRQNGDSGPYTIDLYLYDGDGRQMAYDSFSTAYYSYTSFETTPALFSTPHEFCGWDDDHDGLYDRLLVNATIDVATAGSFYVEGVLYAGGAWWVSTAGAWDSLPTGIQMIQLSFPAWMIAQYGWIGTYSVDLELYDSAMYWLDGDWFSTTSFDYNDFNSSMPRINSNWAFTVPVVDGVMNAGEWASATVIDLEAAYPANDLQASLFVQNDGTMLYIAYDVYGDMTEDTYDYSSIGFDTDNDDIASTDHEDQFMLTDESWAPQNHYVYNGATWTTHCSPFSDAGLSGTVGFGSSPGHPLSHRIYEYAIPLALLQAEAGDVIGFLGRNVWYYGAYDDTSDTSSSWPVYISGTPIMAQYGEIALALDNPAPAPTTTAYVSGTPGTSGWYTSSVSVSLSATGGRGGFNYSEYRLDGGAWIMYSAAIPISSDGTHVLEYRSVDNASQMEATRSLTVKIDRVAPTTVAQSSGADLWFNATDATSGLLNVKYRVDNGTWQTYSGMVTISGAGSHQVEFYATDVAGNQESIGNVVVVVDEDKGGSTGISGVTLLIGLIVAVAVAMLLILLVVMKRRKGQQPMAPYQMPPGPPMQPPQ